MKNTIFANNLLNAQNESEFWGSLTWNTIMDYVGAGKVAPNFATIQDVGRALSPSGDFNLTSTSLLDSDGDTTSSWASLDDNFDIVTTADIADLSALIVDETATGGSNGIVSASYVGSFLAISDTVNGDNTASGSVTAAFTFDISNVASDLSVSLDWAAFGDFETSNDFFTVSASIDGGAAQTLMTLSPDETATQTYTFDDASTVMLDDPMQVTDDSGTSSLSNVFQSFTSAVTGIGSTLVITITGQTDSGAEALVARNIVISGDIGTPVISAVETTPFIYEETGGEQVITATLTLVDSDDTDLQSASVAITGGFDMVNDSLIFADQNGITGSYDAGLGVLTLTGLSTVANYQAALRSVTYLNGFGAESTATRSFDFTVNDGGNNSNTESRDFDFNVNETIVGTIGNDTISGGFGMDTITGDDGDDILNGDEGRDTIEGGNGNDIIHGGEAKDFLMGGTGDDQINGDAGRDVVDGGEGDDIINGGVGDDTLRGGDGVDTINGGGQNDLLLGGNGSDDLSGDGGNDTLFGQGGKDNLSGGLGNDNLDGGGGADILNGNGDQDILSGQAGNDILNGGGENDMLFGGTGQDILSGGADGDQLWGNDGSDMLMGDGGDDILDGGAGNDELTGGNGVDTFVFADDFGSDIITDFLDGFEKIDFSSHSGLNNYDDVFAIASYDGTNTTIMLDANNALVIENFDLADLDASDFIFI